MIYLDNAATTKIAPEVLAEMIPFLTEEYGNPSASNQLGYNARAAVEHARVQVADSIGANPNEIFFTSGATEANNWIAHIFGCAGGSVGYNVTSHPSITESIVGLPFSKAFVGDGDTFELATNILVNNETGIVDDRGCGQINHFDITQAMKMFGKRADEFDALSFSGHKIHGPKGIGALYINANSPLYDIAKEKPFIAGGHQETGFRSGTENVAAIVGMGKACEMLDKWDYPSTTDFYTNIKNIPGATINGDDGRRRHIYSVRFDDVNGEELMYLLAERGVIVSTGSACHNNKKTRSSALRMLKLSDKEIDETIRISVGRYNTKEELAIAAKIIKEAVEDLRY